MALVNQAKREINAKIVFFGPGFSGKATNLKHVHAKLKPEFRGTMKAMSVKDARMLFFDFTPPGDGNVHGYRVRFHVYTVSGEIVEPAAWKMVLKGVDGIVFVADAQKARSAANQESLDSLGAYLKGYGQSLCSVPVVLQYNKSDLPDALDCDQLDLMLNPSRLPSFRATSLSGDGVLQTLLGLVKAVLTALRAKGLAEGATDTGVPGAAEPPPLGSAPVQAAPAPHPPQAMQPSRSGQARQSEAPLEGTPAPPQAPAPKLPQADTEEPLSLELSGVPQCAGPGLFRLPLTIRSGSRARAVLLSIALSLEEP